MRGVDAAPSWFAADGSGTRMSTGPLTIAVDARMAAEVPAGRGRYMRELIRHMAPLLGGSRLVLYARRPWEEMPRSDQLLWRIVPGGDLRWPIVAGLAMRGACDVALATSSYLLCATAAEPVHTIVWDLAPFHSELRTPRASLLERLTLPLAVHRCASFVAISEATRDELVLRYPSCAGRTGIAHPAAGAEFGPQPTNEDEAALARHGVRCPYVLATGTLEPRKNLPRLISAFASLQGAVRGDCQLVLAGAPGWETAETFSHVASHARLVRTLGYVPDEDLAALYRGAEVFCYPSLYEGFGIPVLEAMRSGTPVLTSRRSSMPEVAGEAASYVDPYDTADIARGLTELLSDASVRRTLGERGLRRAETYTWEKTARAVLEVLQAGATREG